MKSLDQDKRIYTIYEITRNVKFQLEGNFKGIWVQGEISNFLRHTSGHMYFSLKDEKSVLKCAMFRRSNQKLAFDPENGMNVLCFGSISVYEPRGEYQLIAEEMEPKGIGLLEIKFKKLKEKLFKEGLFDERHKKAIPFLPEKIGIITSPTGAAVRDILNVLERRYSNVEIIINPVKVQGKDAKFQIVEAIQDFNNLKNVEVILLSRGGGSIEDLWPFNEEEVGRAIFDSEIPVISGIGHEVDFTIADFISDLRAPTPSAAAELVLPEKEKLVEKINLISERLKNALIGKLDLVEEKLMSLKESYVLKQPLNVVMQFEQRIDEMYKSIGIHIDHILDMRKESFNSLVGKLEVLSPLGILARGYSITKKEQGGAIIKDAKSLSKNDIIKTKLSKGEVTSRVEDINSV